MDAREALAMGIADELADAGDPRELGLAYARRLLAANAPARPVGALPAPAADEALFAARRREAAAKYPGEPARTAAVASVANSTRLGFAEGLVQERAAFQELIETPQRAALIHALFAERAVSRLPEIAGIAPRAVASIGIIGGGTMGAGIATAALLGGLNVVLVEVDAAAAERARTTITANIDESVRRGKLGDDEGQAILADRLRCVADYAALAATDMVIEAVFEDMAAKQQVFARIEKATRPGTILATNTSYLDVNEIAAATGRPGDVLGLHFFSPAHVMKLLEIVVADRTDPDVVATGFALVRRLGKIAVRSGVCDGFIGNRILAHYRNAVDHMVLDGASPYAIDDALRDFGFAMGPYEVSDLAGLDIGYMTRQRKAAFRHPLDRVPDYPDALYHAGLLGRKTGAGYYLYDERRQRIGANPATAGLIEAERARRGVAARAFEADEIQRRFMAAMINEAAGIVAEGIATRRSDVDVVMLNGYGFPRWRGGPMHWADAVGLGSVLDDIREFGRDDPHFWRPAPLLERLVREGRGFESLNQ